MKGIILAGGLGTRLDPLTRVTNKHLLPVYDKPMIYYPVETLVEAGINDIMIVTGGNNAGDFLRLLKNGQDFGLRHLHFAYQEGKEASRKLCPWRRTSLTKILSAWCWETTSSNVRSVVMWMSSANRAKVPRFC